jgi:hypothetical protein
VPAHTAVRLQILTTEELIAELFRNLIRFRTRTGVGRFGFHRAGKDLSDAIDMDEFLDSRGATFPELLTAGITLYRVEPGQPLLGRIVLHEYTLSPIGDWVYEVDNGEWGDRLPWLYRAFLPPRLPANQYLEDLES